MIRSENPVAIAVPNVSVAERVVGVVYPGPVLAGAVLWWRARFTSISVNNSAAIRVGVALPGEFSGKAAVSVLSPSPVTGETLELSGSLLADLAPGDPIEFRTGSATPGVWNLDPFGFTVEIR